jgi:hypothetical protein
VLARLPANIPERTQLPARREHWAGLPAAIQLLSMISLWLAALLFLNVSSSSSPTAVEQLTSLRQQANAAREAGEHGARLQAVLKVQRLLNDAPDATLAAARAYAEAGDAAHALAALERFAQLGQVDEGLLSGTDRSFAVLQDRPEYKRILQRLAANKRPISQGEMAFMLPDPGILAEDIAYDPRSNTFLITSVLEKKILRITFDGRAETDFATSPSHWPMLAVKVDPVHNLVWATEVALDGFTTVPKADWGRSALVCFDLRTGVVVRRIEGPAKSALGDLALTPEGVPIVSDGDGGVVYRVVEGRLQLINGRDFISPQTPAVLADGEHAFVPDYARGIGLLDLKTSQVVWLNQQQGSQARGIDVALNGIDGLYFNRGSLILTQNGTSPERVIRLRLNPSLTRVVSQEIIEQATPTLGDPTHGVIVADYFYYIANSGWSELDQHGDLKPGSKLTPARIMRVIL